LTGCGSEDESTTEAQGASQQLVKRRIRVAAARQRHRQEHRAEVRAHREAIRRHTRRAAARERLREENEAIEAEEERAAEEAESAESSECDPNYSGACLDPYSSDYDCEGGSGDGPDYTGPVSVVGEDHYGLDSDNDGYACEPS